MSDESTMITNFISITGAETDVAKQYLQASSWELSTAVDRFYTNPPVSEQNQPLTGVEPEVRAPIAATFDTLVGAPAHPLPWMSGIVQQPRPSRDWGANWQGGQESSRNTILADLFKAPEYKFTGTLQEACRKAEQESKAVVVNIQSVQEFKSHLLNRDVWKDVVIKQMVDHNFILCQWDVDHPEGQKYIQFYNCYEFPHLAILNPTIRKEVVRFSDKRSNLQVQEVLLGYLEQKTMKERRSHHKPSEEGINPTLKQGNRNSVSSNEENMIQAAIQASLIDRKEEVPDAEKKNSGEDKTNLPALDKSKLDKVVYSIPPEPELSDQTTNLRVQFPDGGKLSRRFCLDAKAQLIYDWCASECKSSDFTLSIRFPRKVLGKKDFSLTLRELGFRNIQLFLTKKE